MDRDKGLRRTTAITGALAAASIAGTLAVGLAAHASESTTGVESAETGTAPATDESATTQPDSPSLQSGSDDSGQVTSGGS